VKSAKVNYPTNLRIIAGATLVLIGLGFLNRAFWQVSILGLSQKQMLILSFVPAGIASYYFLAWAEGPGADE
jgi:hypothetical protein